MWQRWCKMVDECKRAPDCSTRSGSGEWGGGGIVPTSKYVRKYSRHLSELVPNSGVFLLNISRYITSLTLGHFHKLKGIRAAPNGIGMGTQSDPISFSNRGLGFD